MPLYETVIIARQDISSQQVETLTETASAFITDGGGSIAKVEQWGLRNLAYKIKKNRKGHYVLLNVDAPADAMKEMERNLRLNEDVLRHMTIKVDELEEGDSIMLQSRSARPERRSDRDDDGDGSSKSSTRDDDTAGAKAEDKAEDKTEKEDA